MNIPDEINVQEIDLLYLVANTPSYLYKHLRHANSVQLMVRKLSVEALALLYNALRSEQGRSKYPVSLSYAILAALTLKESALATEKLRELSLEGLDWGKQFLEVAFSQAKPTERTIIRVSAQPKKVDIPTAALKITRRQ